MSKDHSDRLADGDYTADDWKRNDPHSQETTRQDWGEYTWDEYSEGHQRTQDERKRNREGWGLTWD